MPFKTKVKVKMSYLHREEVPFYKLRHSFDDLPLDPAKPFILEKLRELLFFHQLCHISIVNPFILRCKMVEKMRTSRSAVNRNLNVHTYELNESCTSTAPTIVSSEKITDLRQVRNVKTTSIKATEKTEYDWTWLTEESNCKSMQSFLNIQTKKTHIFKWPKKL